MMDANIADRHHTVKIVLGGLPSVLRVLHPPGRDLKQPKNGLFVQQWRLVAASISSF
jgi:hypothetical protein